MICGTSSLFWLITREFPVTVSINMSRGKGAYMTTQVRTSEMMTHAIYVSICLFSSLNLTEQPIDRWEMSIG